MTLSSHAEPEELPPMLSATQDDEANFDFDEEFNRRQVPALKYHQMVLGDVPPNDDDLFVAGVADMDFAIAPCIQQAIQQRIQHPLLGYEAVPSGLLPALSEWMLKRHGSHVEEGHILRAPNVLNALAMTMCTFTKPGDAVIVQPPVFFDFFDIIAENHRTLLENPLLYDSKERRYTMDFENLQQVAPEAKMLFLCNPHNPVGRVWSKDELRQLAKICHQHNVLVVSDEIHADLCYDMQMFTPMGTIDPENSITLTSPAKTFNLASCCCAFTIIHNERLRKALKAENSRLTVNKNNAFANVAMEAAYRRGESWLNVVMKYMKENVNLLRKRLASNGADGIKGIRLVESDGTFLLWLDCRDLMSAGVQDSDGYALRQWFRESAGWAVTRGAAFGKQGHGFVRVNIACPRRKLEAALDRLEEAVEKLYSHE